MNLNDAMVGRAREYAQRKGLTLGEQLGAGVHGIVYATESQHENSPALVRSALKAHQHERYYLRERDVYGRLKERGVTSIRGCEVPRLLGHDDGAREDSSRRRRAMKTRASVAVLLSVAWIGGVKAQVPGERAPAEPALRLRLSVTEKTKEPPDVVLFNAILGGDMFFAPDGDSVFVKRSGYGTVVPDCRLGVWNVASQKKVKEIVNCQAAALSPDGKSVAMIGPFNSNKLTLRLVQPSTLQVTQEADFHLPDTPARTAEPATPMLFQGTPAFTPAVQRLAIQDVLEISLWDIKTNKVSRVLADHPIQRLLGFASDGKAVCLHNQGCIGLWHLPGGKLVCSFGSEQLQRAASDPAGGMVATFGGEAFGGTGGGLGAAQASAVGTLGGVPKIESARIQLWDVASGKRTWDLDTKIVPTRVEQKLGNGGSVAVMCSIQDVAFSSDGLFLASCMGTGEAGHIQIFDTRTGKQILHEKLTFCPQAIAFSRDGTLLATAGGVGAFDLRVWDVLGVGTALAPFTR
jgi:hypothetical protein